MGRRSSAFDFKLVCYNRSKDFKLVFLITETPVASLRASNSEIVSEIVSCILECFPIVYFRVYSRNCFRKLWFLHSSGVSEDYFCWYCTMIIKGREHGWIWGIWLKVAAGVQSDDLPELLSRPTQFPSCADIISAVLTPRECRGVKCKRLRTVQCIAMLCS